MTVLARLALAATATVVLAQPAASQVDDPGRLYGRVITMDGSEFEGFIRWDGNEGHWTDHIDAAKRLPRRFMREAERLSGERYERERAIRVLGVRVGWETDSRWSSSATSVIRFGHISRIEVLDDSHGLLTLKSGELGSFSTHSGSYFFPRKPANSPGVRNGPSAIIVGSDTDVGTFRRL